MNRMANRDGGAPNEIALIPFLPCAGAWAGTAESISRGVIQDRRAAARIPHCGTTLNWVDALAVSIIQRRTKGKRPPNQREV